MNRESDTIGLKYEHGYQSQCLVAPFSSENNFNEVVIHANLEILGKEIGWNKMA